MSCTYHPNLLPLLTLNRAKNQLPGDQEHADGPEKGQEQDRENISTYLRRIERWSGGLYLKMTQIPE